MYVTTWADATHTGTPHRDHNRWNLYALDKSLIWVKWHQLPQTGSFFQLVVLFFMWNRYINCELPNMVLTAQMQLLSFHSAVIPLPLPAFLCL